MLRCKGSANIGVRVLARTVAGVSVCATLLLTAASAQATGGPGTNSIDCGPDQNIFGQVVPNNVTVPPGWVCNLVEVSPTQPTIVLGNVTVGRGARFLAFGSVLRGNLASEGAEGVQVVGSVVDGNTSLDATSATGGTFFCDRSGTACLLGSEFGGNVSITNTSPLGAEVAENLILRDLTCRGNASVTNIGFPNTVFGQEFGQCVGL